MTVKVKIVILLVAEGLTICTECFFTSKRIKELGANLQTEVDAAGTAIKKVGGVLTHVSPVDSFGPLGQRTIVIVKKVSATPDAFPRDNGLPKKRPL